MNKALKLLDELEQLIYVPNVDKEPQDALNGLKALNLINDLRSEFKNISFHPPVIGSFGKFMKAVEDFRSQFTQQELDEMFKDLPTMDNIHKT